MFNWLGGLLGNVFKNLGGDIANSIWDNLMKWLFQNLYDTTADVFTQIGGMGAEIFDLSWIESAVRLFFLFGWVLFGVGVVVAAFDLAIEYQNGRATIKSTALNVLKGFFAANLVTVVPVELSGERNGRYFMVAVNSPHEDCRYALYTERSALAKPEFTSDDRRALVHYINELGPQLAELAQEEDATPDLDDFEPGDDGQEATAPEMGGMSL